MFRAIEISPAALSAIENRRASFVCGTLCAVMLAAMRAMRMQHARVSSYGVLGEEQRLGRDSNVIVAIQRVVEPYVRYTRQERVYLLADPGRGVVSYGAHT